MCNNTPSPKFTFLLLGRKWLVLFLFCFQNDMPEEVKSNTGIDIQLEVNINKTPKDGSSAGNYSIMHILHFD